MKKVTILPQEEALSSVTAPMSNRLPENTRPLFIEETQVMRAKGQVIQREYNFIMHACRNRIIAMFVKQMTDVFFRMVQRGTRRLYQAKLSEVKVRSFTQTKEWTDLNRFYDVVIKPKNEQTATASKAAELTIGSIDLTDLEISPSPMKQINLDFSNTQTSAPLKYASMTPGQVHTSSLGETLEEKLRIKPSPGESERS